MRIFIAFEGLCEPFDISQDQTIQAIKMMVKDFFHLQLIDNKQSHQFLELSYAGATLEDSWVLADIGITPFSTIKCVLKEEDKPVLLVYNTLMKESMQIMGNLYLLSSRVSTLKTMISMKCGLPVSVFWLSLENGVQLYDCNKLDDYGIEVGATIFLTVWDGWDEFLRGCFMGHKHKIYRCLSKEEPVLRFQQRVALYISAFLGHLELAGWLLKKGVRANKPVGVHPYRAWCQDMDHADNLKCPVHTAAESGQLLLLKVFINNNILCLESLNPLGLTPLRICIKHKHKECVLYLVTKMWSVVSYPGLSLPVGIYIKIKRWICRAQKHIVVQRILCRTATFNTRVGDTVLIDGFIQTKPKNKVHELCYFQPRYTLPALCSETIQKENNEFPNEASFPHIQQGAHAETRKKRRVNTKKAPEAVSTAKNTWKSQVPLPPISQDTNPRPQFIYTSPDASFLLTSSLQSFTRHSGWTPRENAIYCLARASSFTEKPWLRQLGMARNLARRTVHNIT
ncbi:protein ANKUB1-like [Erpetoichthys calabaricus]|uniref:Ankyrin repeat and ubiquitin domain containing 1 n=1 Tax=Erpetoichthys calabaricus TaxID=27687 RepID=A0A8C4S5D5_ERPCA|nr:protein ANKUB1-like [Erpetoichthys calabaricus]